MKILLLMLSLTQVLSSVIDVFEATNGHEPRVAIYRDHVPFYVDLQTGAWVEDSEGLELSDQNKEVVKKYCQKTYPKLNITNIVEANQPQNFNNWCKSGQTQCTESKAVVPYRCLVNEYEADALMVPDGCKFDHIHDPNKCLSHDDWAVEAKNHCKATYNMNLKDYGILLSCGTDMFTGVEFVCCPEKKAVKPKIVIKKPVHISFKSAVADFLKYLPKETKGCDRTTYLTKQATMEENHRRQIAAVVDEWDNAEKRYIELKAKDPVVAEEKMKRTLEVFRQTLAALEQESKDEKERLRVEHADCINTQISKNKRDAMVAYLTAIQKEPVNAEDILKAVRKFIQVCEHDRVHSLRHFEHVRRQDASKADAIRGELLDHLKNLNKVVNESMSLLNYLPEIAKKFGLTGNTIVLKPKMEMPEIKKDDHIHKRIQEILKKNNAVEVTEEDDDDDDDDDDDVVETAPTPIPTEKKVVAEKESDDDDDDDDDDDNDEDLIFVTSKPVTAIPTSKPERQPIDEEPRKMIPLTKSLGKITPERKFKHHESHKNKHYIRLLGEDDVDMKPHFKTPPHHKKEHKKSPMVINIILGLCCGILVVMLVVVIVMVVQRRRVSHTRVVVAENDDREHLIQMQKNGFENPTYKFFYY